MQEGLNVHEIIDCNHAVHSLNDRGDRRNPFGEVRNGIAPAHDAVTGRDLEQVQVPCGIEVFGLRVGDRYRFNLGNLRAALSSWCGCGWW